MALRFLLAFALLTAVFWKKMRTMDKRTFLHGLALGAVGGLAGQLGDLFASLVKRHCGVKDFGTIFPGHGGMMDRLDSVYWATVVVYVYLNLAIAVMR